MPVAPAFARTLFERHSTVVPLYRRLLLVLCVVGALSGCANLIELKRNIQSYDRNVASVSGELLDPACRDCPILVVALDARLQPLSYKVFEHPGAFRVLVSTRAERVFAFQDVNGNYQYDVGEPYDVTAPLVGLTHEGEIAVGKLALQLRSMDAAKPVFAGSLFGVRSKLVSGVDIQLGVKADLMAPPFSQENASLGMWQPMTFMRRGLAGIYFLDDYDPAKVPVLFIHGINGSPRDFAQLVQHIDRTKFQPWLAYYPSGLEIQTISVGLLGMINKLAQEHRLQRMHIVAHSMGGLVGRQLLNTCQEEEECDYVRTFVTISSPFGGAAPAKSGLEHSPVVMPVWRSLNPDGDFLRQLFARPLPPNVTHHMLFGYRNTSTLSTESSDGTVPLGSQLRPVAQRQAVSVLGLDEDHLSILDSQMVGDLVNAYLSR